MKTIYLLRHAKAERDATSDHARPLAERGQRDARRMGRHLATLRPAPEHLVTSTALRAWETLDLAREAGGLTAPTVETRALYETDAGGVLAVLRALPESVGTVLVVGHEPTLSETAGRLARTAVRLPTGTLVRLDVDAPTWTAVGWGLGTLVAVVTPDSLADD